MPFERYLRQRGSVNKPVVSIWKTGHISVNRAALKNFGLEKMTHAALFYDREKKKIALRFADSSREEGAAKLVKRGDGRVLFTRGFLNYYGIDYSKARRFTLVRDEKQNLFVLEAE